MTRIDEIRARLGEGDTTPLTEPQLVRCVVEMLDGRKEDRISFFQHAESDVAWLLAEVARLTEERARVVGELRRRAKAEGVSVGSPWLEAADLVERGKP